MQPVIITLAVDPVSQGFLNTLRTQYFPANRNFIDAHITMFHKLDGLREKEIIEHLKATATRPFPVEARALRSLGRGVAITIASATLLALHARLAAHWSEMLTPQDRQKYEPHVTIQNKVGPQEARALMDRLAPDFSPFVMQAAGVSVWRYFGGPWDPVVTVPFPGPRTEIP